uniref:Receptor ligand binding region domain-containing protein n=1 Tax=Gopherus agassizii TaxID=38772 RepID=A0A452HGE8_9SAUR
ASSLLLPTHQRCVSDAMQWALVVLCGVLCQLGGSWGQGANLTLAVLLPKQNMTYPWAWPRVGPAIWLAIDQINRQPDLLPGHTVRWVFGNSEDRYGVCSEQDAPVAAVDLKMTDNPDAFIGPGCVYSSAPVARLTSHWKLPLVTAGAEAHGFDNKDMFSLTTRAGPSHRKLGEYVVGLQRHFNWTQRAVLVYSDERIDDRPCYFAIEGLYMELPTLRNLTVLTLDDRAAHVVYICCSPDTFRQFLLQAWHEGLTQGDYAFFYIDIFGASLKGSRFPDPQRPWRRGDKDDANAREAFKVRSAQDGALQPGTLQGVGPNVIKGSLEARTPGASEPAHPFQMNYIAAAFHDGVLLYARAVNETLQQGGTVRNASTITRHMWNRTFYGKCHRPGPKPCPPSRTDAGVASGCPWEGSDPLEGAETPLCTPKPWGTARGEGRLWGGLPWCWPLSQVSAASLPCPALPDGSFPRAAHPSSPEIPGLVSLAARGVSWARAIEPGYSAGDGWAVE